jgi:ADP-heptose:LPS heptosyltransferase
MLCRELAPVRVVIVGQSDAVLEPLENVVELLNRTSLPELIWLIRRATFVISVDSGPAHIAAALTSQLVAVHTWSDPNKVGPYRADAWVCQRGILSRVADLEKPDQHLPIPDMRALAAFVRTQLPASPR